MFIDWFNAKDAVDVGTKLADDLSIEWRKYNSKKEIAAAKKILKKLFAQAGPEKIKANLNFYKKSKLANEFKWQLLALGHSKEFVDDLTNELLFYIN